jgi:very-short-patch-repair endonuclease
VTGWERALGIARRQGGAAGRRQLLEAGLSTSAIDRRRRSGSLHDRHPAVYAVGRPELSPYGEAHAAVLATCGRGALGGASALALVGAAPWPAVPQVLVVGGPLRLSGAAVRRTRRLPEADLRRDRHGLVACRWPRALVDLAAVVPVAGLQDHLDGLERIGLLDVPLLQELVARQRWPGVPKLRRAWEPFLTISGEEYRSLLERFTTRVLRRAGVDGFRVNAPLTLADGRRVVPDLWFAEHRLAVELDGRSTHARARAFEADRRRDRELLKAGIRTARFAWQDVRFRPTDVCRDIDDLLRAARGRI